MDTTMQPVALVVECRGRVTGTVVRHVVLGPFTDDAVLTRVVNRLDAHEKDRAVDRMRYLLSWEIVQLEDPEQWTPTMLEART